MATGTITRTIGTTFTISGIQSAIASLRRVATSFTGNLQAMRAAAARYLAPIIAGLNKIAAFSFKKLQQAASLAFKGIAAGAVLASLKIKAIAAAALESSKGIAELMNQISKDSRRLGISTRDLSALRFGFEKQGVEPDEVLQSLSDIGNEFKAIRQQIDAADLAYSKTKSWNLQKVLSFRNPQSITEALTSNADAAPNSFSGIADQQALIRKRIEMSAPGENKLRLDLVEQYKALETARTQLIQGLGQQGQALFSLQDYGLDFDKAVQGGVEGLTALSEAFRQVQDPALKLRISMQLFGEDAGAKMVTVLESGREGIESYRKEVQRLGGDVTDADAKLGSDYNDSLLQTKLAVRGVRLELARGLLPLLIESQTQLQEWLVKNRTWIAETMKAAFVETRDLFYDIIDLFHGKQNDFRNSWVNAAAPALIFIGTWIGRIQNQVGKIFSGKDSDWTWLNLARDGLVSTYKLIKDIWTVAFGGKAATFPWVENMVAQIKWVYSAVLSLPEQIKTAWNGGDSDWGWLNTIRDGLLYVRDLAVDVWSVLTGGDAQRFGFLNGWRDQIVDFANKAKAAFDIVASGFEKIHAVAQKFFGLFGGDATTIALVGIFTKIAIAITGIGTAARGAWWLVKTLLGLGGLAAAGTAATTAAAGAAGAAGAAVAGGGLVATLASVGTLVLGLIRSFGVLGAVVTGVVIAGKYALDYSEKSGDNVIQKQLELMRFQADRQVQAREDWKIMHPVAKPFEGSFMGEKLLTRDQLNELSAVQNTSAEAGAVRSAGIVADYARNNQRVTERIALDLNLGGKTVSATIDRDNADMLRDINRNLRTY
ncbi:hypothetical protein ACS4RR_021020 [Rhizobium sp. Z1P35]